MKLTKILKGPAGPTLTCILGYGILFILSPHLSAVVAGTGTAMILMPSMLIGSLITGVVTKTWWHSLVGISISYLLSRLLFITRLDPISMEREIFSFCGALMGGLIVVGIIVGISKIFTPTKSRNEQLPPPETMM